MTKKEKKKPQHLDDVLEQLAKEHSASLDEAFKAHDSWFKEEHQNHLYNNVLAPGQDTLYKTISSELDKVFKDDDAKVRGKEKEVKKAVSAGLKKYFSTVQPSLGKLMQDMDMNEEEQYDFLTSMYDEHVGHGKIKDMPSIKSIEASAKDKKSTVGHIKRHIDESRGQYIKGALQVLGSRHTTHHFSKYHPAAIAGYLKPHIEKAGFEIEDKVGYATAELGELLGMRRAVVEKEGHHYLKKKEEEKK